MTYLGLPTFLNYSESVLQDSLGVIFIILGVIAFLFLIAIYVYQALAWVKIAKKMKYKHPWLAWIPFAGSAMRLQLGGFHWAWIFLVLIPIFGWIPLIVLLTIAMWRIYEKRKFPAWLSLGFAVMFIPKISGLGFVAYMVSIGLIAWKKKY